MPEPVFIADSIGAASVRTATGAVLLTTPFWAEILYTVNVVAATIASVCGAIIGVTGVWRLVMRRGRRS
jgi:hypothetical protein